MKITIVHSYLGLATDESADRLLASLVAAHKVWTLAQLHSVLLFLPLVKEHFSTTPASCSGTLKEHFKLTGRLSRTPNLACYVAGVRNNRDSRTPLGFAELGIHQKLKTFLKT